MPPATRASSSGKIDHSRSHVFTFDARTVTLRSDVFRNLKHTAEKKPCRLHFDHHSESFGFVDVDCDRLIEPLDRDVAHRQQGAASLDGASQREDGDDDRGG